MPEKTPQPPAGEQQPQDHHNPYLVPVLLIAFCVYYLTNFVLVEGPEAISYSRFVEQVTTNQVQSVLIRGRDVRGRYAGTEEQGARPRYDFHVVIPEIEGERLLDLLSRHNVTVDVLEQERDSISIRITWPAIAGATAYSMRLQAFNAGEKTSIGKQSTTRNHAVFDLDPAAGARRYEWILTGETEDEKTFYTNGGFVISPPANRSH